MYFLFLKKFIIQKAIDFFKNFDFKGGIYITKLLTQFVVFPQISLLKTEFSFSLVFELWFWYFAIKYDFESN